MANINFGMVSDHSDNEFNYPDEVEKFSDKENIGPQQKENQQKAQFTIASVQKYILTQRSQNTVKKKQNTKYTTRTPNWTLSKTENSLSPGKFFFLKRNSWSLKKGKEIALMLQKNYPTPKKICCFAPVNSVLKTLKPSNAQFSGYWHCTLDFVPETKAGN